MEPFEESVSILLPPSRITFTYEFIIYETDKDSFACGGNRYYTKDHGFSNGDRVKVSIARVASGSDKVP